MLKGEGDESVRFSRPLLLLSPFADPRRTFQPDSSAPGDLHITLIALPHPTFSILPSSSPRRPANLQTTLSLTLSESLLGFSRLILLHLDGRGLRVTQAAPGEKGWRVLKTGDEVVVKGEGMWRRGEKGDLIIKVEVEMPNEAWAMGLKERKRVEALEKLLPSKREDLKMKEGEEVEEVELVERVVEEVSCPLSATVDAVADHIAHRTGALRLSISANSLGRRV